jgi:predicted transcriptional regulator
MTDINEQVIDEWTSSTTARERIKEILEETTTYSKVSTIADRAHVSEPTTRKYLNELVEEGVGTTEQDGRTTLYKRNQGRLVDRRIEELRTTCSHQELVEGIQDMKESIAEFRETYDLESPEDLVIELEPGDEGWSDVGQWQSTRRNLAIAKAAIQVDEAHRLAEAEV